MLSSRVLLAIFCLLLSSTAACLAETYSGRVLRFGAGGQAGSLRGEDGIPGKVDGTSDRSPLESSSQSGRGVVVINNNYIMSQPSSAQAMVPDWNPWADSYRGGLPDPDPTFHASASDHSFFDQQQQMALIQEDNYENGMSLENNLALQQASALYGHPQAFGSAVGVGAFSVPANYAFGSYSRPIGFAEPSFMSIAGAGSGYRHGYGSCTSGYSTMSHHGLASGACEMHNGNVASGMCEMHSSSVVSAGCSHSVGCSHTGRGSHCGGSHGHH